MPKNTAEEILDTALKLAEQDRWEAVRLFEVARALGMTLEDVRSHYREKEDLVEAWFDRADSAMLREAEKPGFLELPACARLHCLIMAWLDALSAHRRPTRQMIFNKLEPGHLHIQIPALMRISRTVQWIREAAQRKPTFLLRALEETALTSIYLATFSYWMLDDSLNAADTRRFLDRALGVAERVAHFSGDRESNAPVMSTSAKPQVQPATEKRS